MHVCEQTKLDFHRPFSRDRSDFFLLSLEQRRNIEPMDTGQTSLIRKLNVTILQHC